jgi:hypothetical protein
VITIKVLDKTEDDPQLWNEWAEKNKADISKGEREFVDKHVGRRKSTLKVHVFILLGRR